MLIDEARGIVHLVVDNHVEVLLGGVLGDVRVGEFLVGHGVWERGETGVGVEARSGGGSGCGCAGRQVVGGRWQKVDWDLDFPRTPPGRLLG